MRRAAHPPQQVDSPPQEAPEAESPSRGGDRLMSERVSRTVWWWCCNPAGRRHKVAAPWSTALRYSRDLHCIHAFTIKCSDSWAFFHDNVTYQWLLTWLQRPAKMYLPNICRIRKNCFKNWQALRSQARRHDRSGSLLRSIKSTELQSWWRMHVEH